MGWLEEIKKMYFFKCVGCGHDFFVVDTRYNIDEKNKLMCQRCGTFDPEYKGFENVEDINFNHRVKRATYDQNGRKAVRIGNTYMSQTKYNYLETGKIKNVYTPQYEEQLRKDEEKNEYLLKTEENKRRAMVTELKSKLGKKTTSKTI